MNVKEAPGVIQLKGQVEKPADAIDLTGYPKLTYAPFQYGEGVRVASNGVLVNEVANAAIGSSLTHGIEQLARQFDLTWDELFDSLLYARANGPL